ncbi:hypothetical protein FRB96_008884 [Tulasnella sp. 330]|nr:hypothetical protein FRB96_008884 [Tulasnella sp. 330]
MSPSQPLGISVSQALPHPCLYHNLVGAIRMLTSMPLDLSQAIGFEYPEVPVSWTRRDLLIYSVGIGAKKDDFAFVYELDKSFAAFPTYPVVLSFKGTSEDVVDFLALASAGANTPQPPGLPTFDPNRMLHVSQSIENYKKLPVESDPGWKLTRKIIGVHENKVGIVVDSESILVDPKGVAYSRMTSSTFNVGAKATPGGKFSKAIGAAPKASKQVSKGRKPDYVVTEATLEEQALLYRLSGDYNALHMDPSVGKKAGLGGIILHGLSTFGFAARAILNAVGGGEPSALKTIGSRITSPVVPGETLETSIWEVGPGPNDTTEVAFETKDVKTGKVRLGGGIAYVTKKSIKAKL